MPALPKILLLGDSIRMGYQPAVAELLKGRAQVVAPTDNCRFALYTSHRIYDWIAELGTPDIVHWNNGLWDSSYRLGRGPRQFSIDDYVVNLLNIHSILSSDGIRNLRWSPVTGLAEMVKSEVPGKAIGHISFATSTPIDPVKRPYNENQNTWKHAEIPLYNAAARAALSAQGVPINDLYSLMLPHVSEWTIDDGIHLSPAGIKGMAAAVVAHLEPAIAKATAA